MIEKMCGLKLREITFLFLAARQQQQKRRKVTREVRKIVWRYRLEQVTTRICFLWPLKPGKAVHS